jgi:phosphatidylinositol-3-phosphatase
MENKNLTTVFDSTQAPFLHDLAAQCGAAAKFVDHGIRPSLANYLAATSGDTQGVQDDNPPAKHQLTVDNLFRQVRNAGLSAKSYQESMPSNCAQDSTAKYAVKHNPAAYYIGADDRAACQRDDVPFDQFATDLGGNLPAFALITPNICNDMHDCSVSTGDQWLKQVVGSITSSAVYRGGKTAVFVVFDESQGSGTMPFVAVLPSLKPGTVAQSEIDHYSLLAFTEDALGIGAHLGKAANAPSLATAFGI